jgi:anti-sigma factor RsiW
VKSTSPTSASPTWSDGIGDRGHNVVTAVACASASVCVAVDDHGNVLNALPTGAWRLKHVDGTNRLSGVSCPSTSLCVAVDRKGNVVAFRHPNSSKPTWTTSHIDAHNALRAVSCPTSSLCVAVDGKGDVVTSTNPTGGARAWHVAANVDPGLSAVSCSSSSLCVAVDDRGHAVIGTHAGRTDGRRVQEDPVQCRLRFESVRGLCERHSRPGFACDRSLTAPTGLSSRWGRRGEPGCW